MTTARSPRLTLRSAATLLCLLSAAAAPACATSRPAAPPAAQAATPPAPPRRGPPQQDMEVDAATRARVVEALVHELRERYVFPEKAKALEAALRARLQAGAYDAVRSAEALAAALTRDMREVVQDGHLHVAYSEAPVPEQREAPAPSAEELAGMREAVARLNAGFERVERLPFNIGYLDLRGFAPAELSAPKLAAAMALLADTRSLVIDLRQNGGGEPEAVAQLASYFFDERTHLNDIYWREGERTVEFWTRTDVAGPRYGSQRKVYVLTSRDTFSAAEDFSYAMKNLRRATLVGETTGGGAHPGDMRRLDAHFGAFIPMGRSISPVTHTDWEGTGVEPDVRAPAADALKVAQTLILQERLASEKDPGAQERMRARIQELR